MIYVNVLSFALLIFLLSSSLSASTLSGAENGSITVELIHRDSPKSPFFNPSETHYRRLWNSLNRSFRRVKGLNQLLTSKSTAVSVGVSFEGDYLMKILIGTPPFEVFATVDTTSALTWTLCRPCALCNWQTGPLFQPNASSTYRQVACDSKDCPSSFGTYCESNACHYTTVSTGLESSVGLLGQDTLTLVSANGQSFHLLSTFIGCGLQSLVSYVNTTGVVGLGFGPTSLISRMDDSKFSYCLAPYFSAVSGKLGFGGEGMVSGPNVVSTPLFLMNPFPYYYLTLEAMSVGGQKLELNHAPSSPKGNTIIDSGSVLTYLPGEFYRQLELKVSSLINLERVQDPSQLMSLCYKSQDDMDAPIITLHFTGADMNLGSMNTFLRTADGVICFAFSSFPGNDNAVVLGNIAQTNFLIGYDLQSGTLSFKQSDCTIH